MLRLEAVRKFESVGEQICERALSSTVMSLVHYTWHFFV